jgi:hypothetical protein
LQRLHFTVPNTDQAEAIVDELRQAGLSDENLQTVAKDRALIQHLPKAGILEESDFIPALKRGAFLGAVAGGIIGGVVGILLPPSVMVSLGALLIGILAGGAFGAWSSSMMGSSVTNTHLQEHQQALDEGDILLMVDVASEQQAHTVEHAVHKHCSEARISSHQPEARSSQQSPKIQESH